MVAESAPASNKEVVGVSDVVVFVEELILIDRHAIFSELGRFIALTMVRTAISHQDALQSDLHLCADQLVHIDDLSGQVRNIDACVALSCDEKFIFGESWKLFIKGLQSMVVILGDREVVVSVVSCSFAESHLSKLYLTPPGLSI